MRKRSCAEASAALTARLEELGWSRYRLEKELGAPRGYVYRLCSGERAPGLTEAILIERMVGIPVASWADQERLSRAA